jgi:hypothetical protein
MGFPNGGVAPLSGGFGESGMTPEQMGFPNGGVVPLSENFLFLFFIFCREEEEEGTWLRWGEEEEG